MKVRSLMAKALFQLIGAPVCWSAFASTSSAEEEAMAPVAYHFILMKGRGVEVCEAFYKRLSATKFVKPPYCGIPENDSVSGFEMLNRVPLTEDQTVILYPHIGWFRRDQTQDPESNATEWDEQPPNIHAQYEDGGIVAWRFHPKISLNNDGNLDNLMLSQGLGGLVGGANFPDSCGREAAQAGAKIMNRAGPEAYILTKDDRFIDESKTRELFARPNLRAAPSPFTPVGTAAAVFEFRDTYYLGVFYWKNVGDVNGQRIGNPALDDTLAVLLRRRGKTKQVCEYRVTTPLLPDQHFSR